VSDLTRSLIIILLLLSCAVIVGSKLSVLGHPVNESMAAFTSKVILVPENYTSIQEAINAAAPGDTIYVNNGTHYENIIINKTITLVGKNPETTIIDGSTLTSSYDSTVSIYGANARDVIVSNFTIKGSADAWGVYLFGTPNSTVENNIITNNHGGVNADASDNSTFVNNTIMNNLYEGLLFFESSGNTMRNNTIRENLYNFGIEDSVFDDDIDESNLVDGKPIYFLRNQTGITINPTTYPKIGYLALINCSDTTIENLSLSNNLNGIILAQTNNASLTNNTFATNAEGIGLYDSTNNTLKSNNVTNNLKGIVLTNSPNNTLRSNNLTANYEHIRVNGGQLADFLQDIDASNIVDTKLVRYMINQTGLTIAPNTFPNTGYLALVNCQNITAQTLSLQNSSLLVAYSQNSTIAQNNITGGEMSLQHASYVNMSANTLVGCDSAITIADSYNCTITMSNMTESYNEGLYLTSSADNLIMKNNIAENLIGIDLDGSTDNTIVGNNVTANKDYGILLTSSDYNMIYHNNFINNAVPGWQAVCSEQLGSYANDTWDAGYPAGGNYWSDYNGTDQNSGTKQTANGSDAIGDKPYAVNFMQRDGYPLMGPYHDYAITYGQTYHVEAVSNSSIANLGLAVWLSSATPYLQPGQPFLLFFTTGEANTTGFCRVTVPRYLLNGTYTVLVDWQQVPATELAESNSTYAYVYFTYGQSEHTVVIVSEYPTTTALGATVIAGATITAITAKRRSRRKT
jgi:parallel beta-helix repeat protein